MGLPSLIMKDEDHLDLIGESPAATTGAEEFPQLPEQEPATIVDRKDEFLRLIAAGCRINEAARGVGVHRRTTFLWRENPEYQKRFIEATNYGLERLVSEAERRAMHRSDRLLMFLLTSYDANRFPSTVNRNQLTGAGGGPIEMNDLQMATKLASILDAARSRKAAEDEGEGLV